MNLIIPHANKTMQMPCRVLFVCMLPLCFTSFWPAADQNSCHVPIKKTAATSSAPKNCNA